MDLFASPFASHIEPLNPDIYLYTTHFEYKYRALSADGIFSFAFIVTPQQLPTIGRSNWAGRRHIGDAVVVVAVVLPSVGHSGLSTGPIRIYIA